MFYFMANDNELLPLVGRQGAENIDCKLSFRVENSEIKAEYILALRTELSLLLGHAEDVGEEEGLLGDGEGGVLIEPGELPLAQDAPLHLELLLTPGEDVEGARVVPAARPEHRQRREEVPVPGAGRARHGQRVAVLQVRVLGRVGEDGGVVRGPEPRDLLPRPDVVRHLPPDVGGQLGQLRQLRGQVPETESS